MPKKVFRVILTIGVISLLLFSLTSVAFAQGGGQQGQKGSPQDQDVSATDSLHDSDPGGDGLNEQGQPVQGSPQVTTPQSGQMQQGGQMQQSGQMQQGGQQGTQMGQGALACSQTYVVQSGDTLGAIANRFYNSASDWNVIVQATNNAGGNFNRVDNPAVIFPGQTLCIPAQSNIAQQSGQQGQNLQQGQMVQGNQQGQNLQQGQMVQGMPNNPQINNILNNTTLQAGQGLLLVENLTGKDLIFDLTMPTDESAWVGPNNLQPFAVAAGRISYAGHSPDGVMGITPGTINIVPGQVTMLSCNTLAQCQTVGTSFQARSMQQGQNMQQQGTQGQNMQQGTGQNMQQGTGQNNNSTNQ